MTIGQKIVQLRTASDISQEQLAEMLGVSRQSVSKWENNMATPDLDKLIRMKLLFDTTLDELVFDTQAPTSAQDTPLTEKHVPSFRTMGGVLMLIFGMILFLLSIFWGDHLYFGEVFGELFSAVTVLFSIAFINPYDMRVLTVCSIIYFIYMVICFGVLKISNPINSLFTFIASIVIVVWFIICGTHANREA